MQAVKPKKWLQLTFGHPCLFCWMTGGDSHTICWWGWLGRFSSSPYSCRRWIRNTKGKSAPEIRALFNATFFGRPSNLGKWHALARKAGPGSRSSASLTYLSDCYIIRSSLVVRYVSRVKKSGLTDVLLYCISINMHCEHINWAYCVVNLNHLLTSFMSDGIWRH